MCENKQMFSNLSCFLFSIFGFQLLIYDVECRFNYSENGLEWKGNHPSSTLGNKKWSENDKFKSLNFNLFDHYLNHNLSVIPESSKSTEFKLEKPNFPSLDNYNHDSRVYKGNLGSHIMNGKHTILEDSHQRPHHRLDHRMKKNRFKFRTGKKGKASRSLLLDRHRGRSSTMGGNIPTEDEFGGGKRGRRKKAERSSKDKRANIILIMTDDLDVELGSLNYMPRLLKLMGEGGAFFSNAYTTTPMCCPSRSSMLTGMFIHNHQVFTNHQNCSSTLWKNTHEKRTFASYLNQAGYKTAYIGKYLNRYNGSHIPNGWRDWAGLIMNSRYYNYTVNRNNRHVKYGHKYPQDYYPHVITNDGIQYLKEQQKNEDPFLLVLSYPAPHGPEDSAPEHAHKFFNASDHHSASYDYAPNPDKQWILQTTHRMSDIRLKFTDLLMTKRLQTLQTIDEAVGKVIQTVNDVGKADNTYIFFTSDHGYHLGQFGIPKGKSMPFEFDVKVPFMVRGPSVKPGVSLSNIALNVDLAPTFLDIAGVPPPPHMDGRSLLPVLQASSDPKPDEIKWRDSFLIESSGRLREEEMLVKKETRSWQREKALTETLLNAYANQSIAGSTEGGRGVNLYTSKHERLEDVCQKTEFSKSCEISGQKWHCVKVGYKWKIKKCRKKHIGVWHKHCICHFYQGFGTYVKLDPSERRKQRNFLRKYVNKDFHKLNPNFIQSFSNVNSPLQFRPKFSGHRRSKRKNRRSSRHTRSIFKSSENMSWEMPLQFDFGNLTKHMTPVVVDFQGVSSSLDGTSFRLVNDTNFPGNASFFGIEGDPLEPDSDPKHKTGSSLSEFVEEEELRDLKSQIHELTDEIHSLESVTVSQNSSLETKNDIPDNRDSLHHACHSRGGRVSCQDEVYADISTWNYSKVAIKDNIQRHRQQLRVMKNILDHLQSKKPKLFHDHSDYDDGVISEDRDFDLEGSSREGRNNPGGRKKSHHRKVNSNGRRQSMGNVLPTNNEVTGKLYYPISLPDSENEIPGNTLQNRFCWCDKRIIRKIAVQEERDRKRQERMKIRQKIQLRKQRKKRKKEKQKLNLCNFQSLNCYTHDNNHWKTPPLWNDGPFCFCINSPNNTYWCLRTINSTHNFLYCEFITGLITYYDLNIDPYQLRNVAFTLSKERVQSFNGQLSRLRRCKGADECDGFANYEKKDELIAKGTTISNLTSRNNDRTVSNRHKSSTRPEDERRRRKKLRKQRKNSKRMKFSEESSSMPWYLWSKPHGHHNSARVVRKSRHEKRRRQKQRNRRKRNKKKRRKHSDAIDRKKRKHTKKHQ